jgi:hypothetical protein
VSCRFDAVLAVCVDADDTEQDCAVGLGLARDLTLVFVLGTLVVLGCCCGSGGVSDGTAATCALQSSPLLLLVARACSCRIFCFFSFKINANCGCIDDQSMHMQYTADPWRETHLFVHVEFESSLFLNQSIVHTQRILSLLTQTGVGMFQAVVLVLASDSFAHTRTHAHTHTYTHTHIHRINCQKQSKIHMPQAHTCRFTCRVTR